MEEKSTKKFQQCVEVSTDTIVILVVEFSSGGYKIGKIMGIIFLDFLFIEEFQFSSTFFIIDTF